MADESGSPTIYDESLKVVSGTPGAEEIAGPINAGVHITLPGSKTYDSAELRVYMNGQLLESVLDYTYEGVAPRTELSFTFQLVIGDVIRFIIDRGI